MKHIPYSKQSISEKDIEAVCDVLRSDWLTQGPLIDKFERALAEKCGAQHCIMAANGTAALQMACLALGVSKGDIGVTSPISFLASANCIAYCGGRPDFVDIESTTLCLSPEEVDTYCQKNVIPKVVIPVDFAGVPAQLPDFHKLANKYGFKLIEDAAHSLGSTYEYEGKTFDCGSCTHTDLAILSFHPVKTITTGEGGAILTNDDDLAEKLRHLVNHGVERNPEKFVSHQTSVSNSLPMPQWYYEMQTLGYNGRITDIQCALGLSQIGRLDEFKLKRQKIVKRYNQAFDKFAEKQVVILPPWPEETDPCYHLYPIRLGPKCKIERDDLYISLKEKGIHCQIHYIPIYHQPFYQNQYNYDFGRFPESEKYFSSCLSLPLFPELDDAACQFIIGNLISLL
jgi:UDP-4-amino-4,6-dideoxy-N-acetyl-beta-L-altrosamine transaminase